MITIFNPFKFRFTKNSILFSFIFLFSNSIYASENFGDAMKWYKIEVWIQTQNTIT